MRRASPDTKRMSRLEARQGRTRRAFKGEFKAPAVELCQTSGKSIGQVSQDLDLTETAAAVDRPG
jgi:transposase-like protein